MKKLKAVCIFLAAATVIILGALLPVLVGMIQDHTTMGNIDYSDINKLHFELRNMTMAEKMSLLYDSTTVKIDEDSQNSSLDEREDMVLENSSPENITTIFFEAIQPYIQSGLIRDDYYMDKYESQHFLAYNADAPNISNVFYLLNTLGETNGNELNVIIDEQTGIAMVIEYITQKPVYDSWSLEDLMWLCYQIFFDTMGADTETEVYPELVDVNTETGTQTMYITWQVEDGSTISMELSISENGFVIYLNDVIKADTEIAYDN